MIRRLLVVIAAAFCLAGARQESADKPVDALVKAWTDLKFWIVVDGQKTGWQRYAVRWGEYDGEKMVEVNYERVTQGLHSTRFTAWLKPDAFLSPRALRWANTGYDFEIKNGRLDDFARTVAPENFTLFPELLAALKLPTEGASLDVSVLKTGNYGVATGQVKGAGSESPPGTGKSGPACKVTVSLKSAIHAPLGCDGVLWIGEDRSLRRARFTFGGKDRRAPEELIPVDEKEWKQDIAAMNELRAAGYMNLLISQSAHFRSHDIDGNTQFDFWSGDVSGFYRVIPPKRQDPIALIPREMAAADAAPVPPGPDKSGGSVGPLLVPKPAPFHGYLFRAMTHGWYRKPVPLNDGSNRNQDMFAFCAFPAAYGKSGKRTYFSDENNNLYWKDTKGKPVLEVPADPVRESWAILSR